MKSYVDKCTTLAYQFIHLHSTMFIIPTAGLKLTYIFKQVHYIYVVCKGKTLLTLRLFKSSNCL